MFDFYSVEGRNLRVAAYLLSVLRCHVLCKYLVIFVPVQRILVCVRMCELHSAPGNFTFRDLSHGMHACIVHGSIEANKLSLVYV